MQQRRYITSERSSQKDVHRPSYQPLTLSTHSQVNIPMQIPRYGSSTHLLVPPTSSRMKYSDVPRSPSASDMKTRQQHLRGNIVRRKNQGIVSNLKSELQNLKLEVSRIMNKDGDNKTYSSRDSGIHSAYDDYEGGLGLENYGKQISDSVSVTSEKVIDQPLRKLQMQYGSENYDHTHYLELQNNLLKTQLRNLKNKYNATKQQLRQKCQALQKKNDYLEVSLRRSEQSLHQCKRNLEVEMQTIRFQLSRKLQQQIQDDQKRSNEKTLYPQRDNIGGAGNQLMQQKLRKLYQQLNEKSRTINNMNLQFNDIKGQYEKKSFELKKQIEKNSEFSRQLEFARRQNSRNQNMLEQQVSKKMQLTKQVQNLRERVNELTKQVQLKDQIANSSENLESKLSIELQNYKQHEQRLNNQIFESQNELRKFKQLNSTNEEQIKQLKLTLNDFTIQIDQLSRSVRLQKQKNIEVEQNYRRMIDEVKENGQRQMQQLQRQFERFRQLSTDTNFEKEEELKEKVDTDIKQKDRQISKWKAQYKMLKIKFEENFALENTKKEEIQSYYRNYKEFKTKNKVLQMRNKVLQESANQYIGKIQSIQAANLQERSRFLEDIHSLNMHNQQLIRNLQSLELELGQVREILNNEVERANQEEGYRREIEQKVLTLDIDGNEEIMQIIEKIKKRVADQDDKVNKMIKEMKNKDILINKLRQQVRSVMESQERELENFRNKQIADLVHDIQSKTFSTVEQLKNQSKKEIQIEVTSNNQLINENAKLKGEIADLTKNLMELKQQAKSISHLYNIKSSDLEQMRDKHKFQIDIYEQRLEQQEKIKNSAIKNLQAELNAKNEETQNHRNQIKNLNTAIISMNRETFDEALKNQIETAKKLRQQLNKKNEEVYRLRDSHALLKAEFDNLKSESDINKLKALSQRKNLQVQYEVQAQQLKNLLLVEQKKVSSLEQKIKLVIDENKKKDNFIQTYIMGKKLPTNQREFIAAFLKEYEICVTGKNISQKLQSQSQELQKLTSYNFNLMKEIAEMKEKMLLYEAISQNNSQLRQSMEFESPHRRFQNSRNMSDNPDFRPS